MGIDSYASMWSTKGICALRFGPTQERRRTSNGELLLAPKQRFLNSLCCILLYIKNPKFLKAFHASLFQNFPKSVSFSNSCHVRIYSCQWDDGVISLPVSFLSSKTLRIPGDFFASPGWPLLF